MSYSLSEVESKNLVNLSRIRTATKDHFKSLGHNVVDISDTDVRIDGIRIHTKLVYHSNNGWNGGYTGGYRIYVSDDYYNNSQYVRSLKKDGYVKIDRYLNLIQKCYNSKKIMNKSEAERKVRYTEAKAHRDRICDTYGVPMDSRDFTVSPNGDISIRYNRISPVQAEAIVKCLVDLVDIK